MNYEVIFCWIFVVLWIVCSIKLRDPFEHWALIVLQGALVAFFASVACMIGFLLLVSVYINLL